MCVCFSSLSQYKKEGSKRCDTGAELTCGGVSILRKSNGLALSSSSAYSGIASTSLRKRSYEYFSTIANAMWPFTDRFRSTLSEPRLFRDLHE